MKISESTLKQIIKEEMDEVTSRYVPSNVTDANIKQQKIMEIEDILKQAHESIAQMGKNQIIDHVLFGLEHLRNKLTRDLSKFPWK